MEKELLSEAERNFIQQMPSKLRDNETNIYVQVLKGEKNYYLDLDKTKLAYTEIYSKNIFYSFNSDEILLTENWKYQEEINPNNYNISLSVNGGGRNESDEITYCVVSVDFEEGTAAHRHASYLFVGNNDQYENVSDAVTGNIYGRMRIGNTGSWTIRSAIDHGRMKLLDGVVVERQHYTNTATDATIPITFSGNTITLRFHTEDETDYDYNDSFVTVVVRKNDPPVISVNNNIITIRYNTAIRNIVNNANINSLKIIYRKNSSTTRNQLIKIRENDISKLRGINEYFFIDGNEFKVKVNGYNASQSEFLITR